MNLAHCRLLKTSGLAGVWYRAIQPHFWATALTTAHTATIPSRFHQGPHPTNRFEILYLAENHLVALFEVQALLGSPTTPGGVLPHPRRAWVVLNVTVQLQRVADLTDVAEQHRIATTAQELTGDWRGYHQRSPATTVVLPVAPAPTQELGAALDAVPDLEGFLTLSAKLPYHMSLVVFPQKLQTGSFVEFSYPSLGTHRISG